MIQAFLAALSFLFCCVDVYARAGGGGGYGGGGGFGGGGFGGGGFSGGGSYGGSGAGLGQAVYFYFQFVFNHPLIGVPLTIFILWVFIQSGKTANDVHTSFQIGRGLEAERDGRRAEALAQIKETDPAFDENGFLARVGTAFLSIQRSWSDQDLSPVRAFLSDGVFERFGRQIAEQKDKKTRNRLAEVKILGKKSLGYRAGRHYDAAFVGIEASAVDETVSLADGKILQSDNGAFEEVWTFLRRPGVKTIARPGLLEGHCPACGAPLRIADAAQCGSCKAWVNSGEHDWVLVEITQACEWVFPDPDQGMPGWPQMSEADPGLSLESLEDRTSLAFWRWLDARRRRDPAPLRGVATEDFVKGLDFNMGVADAAVGAVDTMAFETGGPFDRAHVRVKWEAEETGGGRSRRIHFFIFIRKRGLVSDADAGLRTARCPSCGAAPETPDAADCAYCRKPFNDGSRQWVLAEVVPLSLWRRPEGVVPEAVPDLPMGRIGLDWGEALSPMDAVAILAGALAADGSVDDRERDFLNLYAEKRGVGPEKAQEVMQAALEKRLDAPLPADNIQAMVLLRGLIRMSLADGRIAPAEEAMLVAFGENHGLKEDQVLTKIKDERSALRLRAKAALARPAA